jgi:hypothetical protein
MPVLVVGNEKNFAALRARLFSGRVPAAAAREIAEAIRVANPHAKLDALRPGTVLTIPDMPRIALEADLSLGETLARRVEELSDAADTLDEVAEAARRRQREDTEERGRLAKSLDRGEIADAAREDPALAAGVEAVRKAVDDDEARAKARAAALKRARGAWKEELDALKAQLLR